MVMETVQSVLVVVTAVVAVAAVAVASVSSSDCSSSPSRSKLNLLKVVLRFYLGPPQASRHLQC